MMRYRIDFTHILAIQVQTLRSSDASVVTRLIALRRLGLRKKELILFNFRLTSATEQKELNELDEQMGTSPPLEMRRTVAAQRVAVPHNIQSPQDRATGNS